MAYTTGNHEDIDSVLEILDDINAAPNNPKLLNKFSHHYAESTIALLNELKDTRDNESRKRTSLIQRGMHRIIVEGFSDKDMHDAFSNALAKVIHYFSETHDVSVNVLGLISLPKGGYRATLEIHRTPITFNETEHFEGQDVELKRIRGREYLKQKKRMEEQTEHLVHDHFLKISGQVPEIPDHFLINITDADLLNMMIEKEFFKASHEHISPDEPTPALVRVIHHDDDLEPE